jgi:hypothetical protein
MVSYTQYPCTLSHCKAIGTRLTLQSLLLPCILKYFTQESERRLYHQSLAYSEVQSGKTGRLQQSCFKRKDRRLVTAKLFHRDGQMVTDRIFITPKTTDAYAHLKVRTWNGRMCILSCKDIHSAIFEYRKDSLTDTWYSVSPPCK